MMRRCRGARNWPLRRQADKDRTSAIQDSRGAGWNPPEIPGCGICGQPEPPFRPPNVRTRCCKHVPARPLPAAFRVEVSREFEGLRTAIETSKPWMIVTSRGPHRYARNAGAGDQGVLSLVLRPHRVTL